MRFVIVTGMSGAGKSTALKMLEDMEKTAPSERVGTCGYRYCERT